MTAISANALASLPVRSDSEEYQERMKRYEKSQCLSEEEIDDFYNVVKNHFNCLSEGNNINNKITKVWVFNKSKDDTSTPYSRFDTYAFEYSLMDYFNVEFDLPIEDGEAIYSELSDTLGYDSYYNIRNSSSSEIYGNCAWISIDFNSDDHELNYMIMEKALSILGEKYPIKEKTTRIDAVNFVLHTRLQTYVNTIYGKAIDGVDVFKMTEEEFKEFYDAIDHDYLKENFRAVYNPETRFIEFPDDYTQKEKIGCFSYFVENFDAQIHMYNQASASTPISVEVSEEISYLNGDANQDKLMTIADAAAIFQSLANPDKYALSAQGRFNADSKGDGITVDDAVAIQKKLAKVE